MEKISFVKMSGAGNDFIVLDKDKNPPFSLNEKIIQKLCDRRNGIGADGVITVRNSVKYDFDMEYFNADGSTGSLCGNGARCAIRFAELSGRIKEEDTKFNSNSVSYSGKVLKEGKIKFNLNPPTGLRESVKLNSGGLNIKAAFINTGSPHVVIIKKDIRTEDSGGESKYGSMDDLPVFTLGREIRYHKEFSPEGTNVNFVDIADGKIIIRTYERGVEDETLACGTGSVASAVICYLNSLVIPPVTLMTRGGDELIVDFKSEAGEIRDVSLTGPAEVVFKGEFLLKKFL